MHDSIEATSTVIQSLPYVDSSHLCKVLFFGTTENFEKWRQGTIACHDLEIRTEIIYNWLKMFKAINPAFKDIEIDNSEKTIKDLVNFGKSFLPNAIHEKDNIYIKIDSIVTDDIAKVRTADTETTEYRDIQDPLGMSEVFLLNPVKDNILPTHDKINQDYISNIQQTFFPKIIIHRTSNTPTNEFDDFKSILFKAFPFLFLFGSYQMKKLGNGSLPKKYILHLMLQKTLKFAQDSKFLFTITNTLMRHINSRSVSLHAINKPELFEKLVSLLMMKHM